MTTKIPASLKGIISSTDAREDAKALNLSFSEFLNLAAFAAERMGREVSREAIRASIELGLNDDNPKGHAVVGGRTTVGGGDDPFSLDNIAVASVSAEDLGIEKPILSIPVLKPGRQDFFRTHPDPAFHVEVRLIVLEADRETYLVTRSIWPAIPGETKLVRLVPYLTRTGTLGLWPVPQPDDLLGKRDTNWGVTARKIAEMATTKWCRLQANMAASQYDVVTTTKIPDPVWPDLNLPEMLKIAFGDGRLIDRMDHPVIRQLSGE